MIYSRIWFYKKNGQNIYTVQIYCHLPDSGYSESDFCGFTWAQVSLDQVQQFFLSKTRSLGEYYQNGLRHVVMHTYIFRVRDDFLPSRKERNFQFSYHLLSKDYLAIGIFDVWKNVNSFLWSQTLRFGTWHRDFIILTWRMFQSLEYNKRKCYNYF